MVNYELNLYLLPSTLTFHYRANNNHLCNNLPRHRCRDRNSGPL